MITIDYNDANITIGEKRYYVRAAGRPRRRRRLHEHNPSGRRERALESGGSGRRVNRAQVTYPVGKLADRYEV